MRENRSTVLILALALAASGLALAGCGSETAGNDRASWAIVPNVIGMDVASAQALIESRGFRSRRFTAMRPNNTVGFQYSTPMKPNDTVAFQYSKPPVGKRAKPGTIITIGPRNGFVNTNPNPFGTYYG